MSKQSKPRVRNYPTVDQITPMSYFTLDSNRPLGKLRTQLRRRVIIGELVRIPIDLFRIAQFRIL